MKQLLQNLKTGEILLEETPLPNCGRNEVLIKVERSLISPGTERMLLEFGKSSYLQKAKQQPDKVKMVLDKIKTDGLVPTLETVFSKLGEPMPLGYNSAGIVMEVGSNVTEFKVGDRVISNGAHSEIVVVGKNLVAKIPDNVSFDEASLTVLASVALQGVRLAQPTLGETFVVIGLGLLGQITLDLLKANGCNAIGVDIDQTKVDLAISNGYKALNPMNGEDPITYVNQLTNEVGVDGVIITAATKANGPIEQAAEMVRRKGRIIAVGAIGMDIPRPPFYAKEIEFFVSNSFGPGKHDPFYEMDGNDYPIGYVRWTENRNFQAILDLLSNGALDFKYLLTHSYKFADAPDAYNEIMNNRDALGVVLEYDSSAVKTDKKVFLANGKVSSSPKVGVGIIGAGNFTKLIVLPALEKSSAKLIGLSSSKGLSSSLAGEKFKATYSTTDYKELMKDDSINTIFITTRHNNHADLVVESLENGKHVFVEKPLAVNMEQLSHVVSTYNKLLEKGDAPQLMVGFNRRFSPYSKHMYKQVSGRSSALAMSMTVNAGALPKDLWVHEPSEGGRIIGEGCHWIDLMSFMANSKVKSVHSIAINQESEMAIKNDNVIINLKFEDGSIGTLQYISTGNKSFSKERLTLFCEGKVLELDNFKKVNGFGASSLKKMGQDKGHKAEMVGFIDNIKKSKSPMISFDSLVNTTLATFAHVKSLEENREVLISELEGELNELIEKV
jgi:predicted dehydrogenase/threonine dehydrogenase-like Zn-dependent dehydrogenase